MLRRLFVASLSGVGSGSENRGAQCWFATQDGEPAEAEQAGAPVFGGFPFKPQGPGDLGEFAGWTQWSSMGIATRMGQRAGLLNHCRSEHCSALEGFAKPWCLHLRVMACSTADTDHPQWLLEKIRKKTIEVHSCCV